MLAAGCSHYCCDAPPPLNLLSAEKNNVYWTAVPLGEAGPLDSVKIIGAGVNTGSNLHDTLGINFKYIGPDNYKITPSMVFYHARMGNGPPLIYFKLDTLFANSFNFGS